MPDTAIKKPAPKTRKPSQTARILENVELLIALHEEQQSLGTAASVDTATIENSVASTVQNVVEDAVQKLLDKKFQALDDRLKKFEAHFGKLGNDVEKGFDRLEKNAAVPGSPSEGSSESMDALVELVSDQMSVQETMLKEQLDKIVESNASSSASDSDNQSNEQIKDTLAGFTAVIEAFKDKFESLELTIEAQNETFEATTADIQANVGELFGKLASAGETQLEESSSVSADEVAVAEPSNNDATSHWQKQKQAMLAKYGIDPEYRPMEESVPGAEPEKAESKLENSAAEKLEDLHDSIEEVSPEDQDAIDTLKRDLNSKLRDAEVELSINRARVSQERAELEQQRSELEQRAADLEAKLAAKEDEPAGKKTSSFMSRFTRHLGK